MACCGKFDRHLHWTGDSYQISYQPLRKSNWGEFDWYPDERSDDRHISCHVTPYDLDVSSSIYNVMQCNVTHPKINRECHICCRIAGVLAGRLC